VGAGLHVQVRAPARPFQVGVGGTPPAAVQDRRLVVAEAFLVAAVVIGVARKSGCHAGVDEGVRQFVAQRQVGDVQRPVRAAHRVAAAAEGLAGLEVGEDGLIGPAAVAELRPGVVVEGLAAHVEGAVDGTRAADDLAARHRESAALDTVLGLGLETPVVAPVVEELGKTHRQADPEAVVLAAGLQEQDPNRRVLAQAAGKDAAGGAGADDDVVVFGGHRNSDPLPMVDGLSTVCGGASTGGQLHDPMVEGGGHRHPRFQPTFQDSLRNRDNHTQIAPPS
jgi:hypothetical protein